MSNQCPMIREPVSHGRVEPSTGPNESPAKTEIPATTVSTLRRPTSCSTRSRPRTARHASATQNLFNVRVSNGILGSFLITPTGDTTLNAVAVHRIVDGEVTTMSTVDVPDALVGR